MKKLGLKKETLAELTADDLHAIVGGGAESRTCTPTYTCIVISEDGGCNISNGCTNISNGCTVIPGGGDC